MPLKKNRMLTGLLTSACMLTAFSVVHASDVPRAHVPLAEGRLSFTEFNEATSGQCNTRQCADLHVRIVKFDHHPALTAYLTDKLLSMAMSAPSQPATLASVQDLQQRFWEIATPTTSEYLQTEVLRNQQNLVVINLTHYLMTGGAHGETESQYVNWLVGTQQALSFHDLLLPGAENKYDRALQEAHQAWLESQSQAIADMQAFHKIWPYQKSHNVALMPDGLRVTYARYAIGPGSFGQPSITIPYERLHGVLKPEILAIANQ